MPLLADPAIGLGEMKRLILLLLSLLALSLGGAPATAKPADSGRPLRVLFVCEHGYAKSLVAARFFERLATQQGRRVTVESRGVAPESPVPPALVANMAGDGFDVATFSPRKLTEADLRKADRVVAFNMDLPAPKEVEVERWDVPALSEEYAAARDAIVARVKALLSR